MPTRTFNYDHELAGYFTDVEALRAAFKALVTAPRLTKRLFVIYGVGGVGKSSLLQMFRLYCKSEHVPVALASGGEAKSALDVLARWSADLKDEGVSLSSFARAFAHYLSVLAKIDEQAKKAPEARDRLAELAGKTVSKSAGVAGGALAGAVIGSVVPGLGTAIGGAVGSVLGEAGGEALIDKLGGFLKKTDIELLRDPTKKLTDEFIENIAKAAGKRRIVLMLDTFEQMTVLNDWAGYLAQCLHEDILLVIAGRSLPNWGDSWSILMPRAQIEELKPMTEDVMRDLVRRYYAKMTGKQDEEPDPVQVEAIIQFAQGLPIVVTSAVQLWVQYAVEDFQSVKPLVVADLVDRLMGGAPRHLIPALEAAAIVRWFNESILRAVTGLSDEREIYDELRHFAAVRIRAEGLALHDAVREIMDESIRVQDPERHKELHQRAAAYFGKQLATASGEEATHLELERLYHHVRADEEAGSKIFQTWAEELCRLEMINRLQTLLNDVNTYPLRTAGFRQWRDYYAASLELILKGAREEIAQKYQKLLEEVADPHLHAYLLCDLGGIYMDRDVIREKGEQGKKLLEQAISLLPPTDPRLRIIYAHLKGYYVQKGHWDEALKTLDNLMTFLGEAGDAYGLAKTIRDLAFIYGYYGDWQRSFELHEQAHQMIDALPSNLLLKADAWARPWYLIWSGKLKQAETGLTRAIDNYKKLGNEHQVAVARRDLAFVSALQDQFEFANQTYAEILPIIDQPGRKGDVGTLYGFWGYGKMREGSLEPANAMLTRSWEIKAQLEDTIGYQEVLYWLGLVNECSFNTSLTAAAAAAAESFYRQSLSYRGYGRRHFECGALTGLARLKCRQGDHSAVLPLVAEAEQLAQRYEYNDHLASLRLTQAMLSGAEQSESGDGKLLDYFKEALIYALRYNRFLLDEVFSGRPHGTPLTPVIPYCLAQGEVGRRHLLALLDWWQVGLNAVSSPRPDSISEIPPGIPLLEAEKIARQREKGAGLPQRTVVERIHLALP